MEEHLICPICKDVPPSEVYQCRNGHQICSMCVVQCTSCPVCQLPYEIPRIRNRALENILDSMDFDCPRKDKGCHLKLRRSQIERHSATECKFRPFTLCKHLGFENCHFVVDPMAPALLSIKHLQTAHKVTVRQGACLEISHENFIVAVNAKCYRQMFGVSVSSNNSCCWPPVIVQVDKDVYGTTLLFLCVSNAEKCSWIPLFMGDSQAEAEKVQVEFSLPNLFGAYGLVNLERILSLHFLINQSCFMFIFYLWK